MAPARLRGLREAVLAASVAAVILLLCAGFAERPAMRTLETLSLDLRFKLRGTIPPGADVALVMVDDRSLGVFGRWPLSRTLYAQAIARLDRLGARVIVFDMLFAEPETPVPPADRAAVVAALQALGNNGDPALRARLVAIAADDPDAAFARAIRASGHVLLPIAFSFTGSARDPDYDLGDSGYARFDPSPVKPDFAHTPVAAVPPIAVLGQAAAGLGHINWINDFDGVPRYDYLALPFQGDFIPSLPIRAVAADLGIPWDQVALGLGRDVRIGSVIVPSNRNMQLLINCLGPAGTVPTFSFADLMDGSMPAAATRGRVVLLGGSFTGNSDSYPSPFGGLLLPGTERLADAIDMILNRRFIAEASPAWLAATAGIVLLLSSAVGAVGAVVPARSAPLAGFLALCCWGVIAQGAFLHGLWLPVVGPELALASSAAASLVFRFGVVEREGRRVRAAFRQYMAPELVDVLAARPERLRLGGETRRMTFLFCDVRGFTTISEGLKADPQGLIQLINAFLTPMTDVIMARGGTIDKYMGDCIMAFWNAPLDEPRHADRACESALAMVAELARVNARLEQTAAADRAFRPLAIGIGLNTGECVVGNMGSARRFDYSVLGDAVNLASRLEGQSKVYGVDIVIGEETRAAAPDWAALELDLIAVKGKHEAVRIFALRGDAEMAGSEPFRALSECHAALLSAYRLQDWAQAENLLIACRQMAPDLATLYDLYRVRIDLYRRDPPGPDWDGVFVATVK
jgi:adenylate cyclase